MTSAPETLPEDPAQLKAFALLAQVWRTFHDITSRLNGLGPMVNLRHVLLLIATYPINQIDLLLPWQIEPPTESGDIQEAA